MPKFFNSVLDHIRVGTYWGFLLLIPCTYFYCQTMLSCPWIVVAALACYLILTRSVFLPLVMVGSYPVLAIYEMAPSASALFWALYLNLMLRYTNVKQSVTNLKERKTENLSHKKIHMVKHARDDSFVNDSPSNCDFHYQERQLQQQAKFNSSALKQAKIERRKLVKARIDAKYGKLILKQG